MVEEVWKPVVGTFITLEDGSPRYYVSNLGNVKTVGYRAKGGKEMSERRLSQRCSKGYMTVCLYDRVGHFRVMYVHRLVAMAFLERTGGDIRTVKHLDGDLSNNRVTNLAWGRNFRGTTPVKKATTSRQRWAGRPVRQYSLAGEFIAEYPSASSAARATYCANGAQISWVCKRKQGHNTAVGFLWRYVDDDEFAQGSEGLTKSTRGVEGCCNGV